jgi:ketosteroid isomerase-like protein
MSLTNDERGVRVAPQEIRGSAGQRRSLDERLVVRFPALAHALASLLFRLSPQSRIRQSFMARSMARAYAAANRRDFDLILAVSDGDLYEYRPSRDLLPPDMAAIYRGHEGYREFWRLWLDAFEDIRWDPEEILDCGDRALVTTRQSGHGSGSGVAVSEPVYQLFTFRRGLVIRQEDFLNRAQALEAAGLSAPHGPS